MSGAARPIALVTGVGSSVGIGAGVARRLAGAGWNVAFTHGTPYDARMARGAEVGATAASRQYLADDGAGTGAI